MDLVLSKLDGFSVLEYIKKENLQTNVFIYSSLTLDGFINKAVSLGAKYYAIKPFSPEILIERVSEVMSANIQTNVGRNSNTVRNEKSKI